MSLFLYMAGCLHDAIDDLHRLNPSVTGSAADMFDRFLGWPTRHTHSYRVTGVDQPSMMEDRVTWITAVVDLPALVPLDPIDREQRGTAPADIVVRSSNQRGFT